MNYIRIICMICMTFVSVEGFTQGQLEIPPTNNGAGEIKPPSSLATKPNSQPLQKSAVVKNMKYNSEIGTYSYTGEVDKEKKPHGKGKALYSDGGTYDGKFYHGIFWGDGILKKSDGTIYDGTFNNNLLVNGKFIAKSGSYFIGTFEDGQPINGVWYDKNGNVKKRVN